MFNELFGGLFGDEPQTQRKRRRRGGGRQRPSGGLHTFTVQKPYCAPARGVIMSALEPYAVPVHGYTESVQKISLRNYAKMAKIELKTFENLMYGPAAISYLPKAIEAKFSVPKAQAEWAEYLIERTGKLAVVGGRVNRRNRGWADKHGGKMPKAWNAKQGRQHAQAQRPPDGEPWIESGCSEGKGMWNAVKQREKEAKEKK